MDIKRLGIITFLSLFLALCVYLLIGNLSFFKIENIRIESKMEFLDKSEIKEALIKNINGNFFTVNLSNIQNKLQSLPFVKDVKVLRIWPNSLKIRIQEIQGIGRVKLSDNNLYILANNCNFLKTTLNRFEEFNNLTIVSVDKAYLTDYEKNNICDTYRFLKEKFSKINQNSLKPIILSQVNINSINSVSCSVNDDLIVNLGKSNDKNTINQKISRLEYFINKKNNIKDYRYIDLRYTNGIAVK